MPINKVQYGNQTLIDLSNSTLQSSDELVSGVTAYDRSGNKLTGTANYMPLIDNPQGNMVVISNADGEVEESLIIITDVATISGDIRTLNSSKMNKISSPITDMLLVSNSSGEAIESALDINNVATISDIQALDSDKLSKTGTQTYNIAGTTFTDGTTAFTITIT